MRRSSSRRLEWDVLESMTLMAVGAPGIHMNWPPGVEVAAAKTETVHLGGGAEGSYEAFSQLPDTGTTYKFSGTPGLITPLGKSTVNGTIESPGFIVNGQSHGTLTIANWHGTLTLQITGPSRPGGPPFPSVFNYTVAGGTRHYKGYQGTGYIDLTLTMTGEARSETEIVGHFSMSFLRFPPP
jgi:hypothetical protein